MGYIPVFTVWKYLVGGIYQSGDLKLKSVKISVQGPFKYEHNARSIISIYIPWSVVFWAYDLLNVEKKCIIIMHIMTEKAIFKQYVSLSVYA